MRNITYTWIITLLVMLTLSSCEKYLDAKPDKALATPSNLKDLEAILNNGQVNNLNPVAGDILSDFYFLENTTWNALTDVNARNTYIFANDTYHDFDWQNGYNLIFRANVVLDGLAKVVIGANEIGRANEIKGSALFFRAFAHFHLAQVFCMPYQKSTAAQTLGLPLKLSSDLNERIVRSNLEESYQSIIKDLKEAAELLPNSRDFKTQASKAACYFQLARIYLIMGEYEDANRYADLALAINGTLLDYNTINATAANPFTLFNEEVVLQGFGNNRGGIFIANNARVNTSLYQSYADHDLRKTLFFRRNSNGTYAFKGDYSGRNNGTLFAGLANDELYLIKAEAAIRLDQIDVGMGVLNQLLVKRFRNGTFTPLRAGNKDEALRLVLMERRKELLFRTNIRWSDIKRLSLEPAYAVSIERSIANTNYLLAVGDLRYANLIPLQTVLLSGVVQNPR